MVSWFSKKQNCVALLTTETEYIAAGLCCAQLIWMRQTLKDYDLEFDATRILCDNTSAINLSKNSILHSRTKHIDVRYNFLKEHVEKGIIKLEFVGTQEQIADIFTKPLGEEQFSSLRRQLGICSS